MWSEFIVVRVSIWLACGLWFLGAISRIVSNSRQIAKFESAYHWAWFCAGIFTWVHVFASYGLIHGWSHASVLKHTGDESYVVIGFRVPWGVYANFIFAGVLIGYSGRMIFKTGPIRWIGLLGFAIIATLHLRCRVVKNAVASSTDS